MRLFSQFHDYYDTAVSYGIDPSVVYDRKQTTIPFQFPLNLYPTTNGWVDHSTWVDVEFFWVGFCGKVFFCRRTTTGRHGQRNVEIVYGHDAIPLKKKNQYDYFNTKLEGYVDRLHGTAQCHDIFLDHRVPCFVTGEEDRKPVLILNPRLVDYEFYKIVQPADAFQQISQFISNDLAVQKDPLPLSDKDRIMAHGMDKWSFRNPDPPKRKQHKAVDN